MLGDLALLGLALCLVTGLVTILVALAMRRRALVGRAARLLAAVVVVYAALLLGASFVSRERVLGPGEEKSVGGYDPHLHFRVRGPFVRDASGDVQVAVFLRSDARRALQDPSGLIAVLVDARGHHWWPVITSAAGLDRRRGLVPFGRTLGPGESYVATLAFRPDPSAAGLRLLVSETGWPCRVTIGHERSPFHRKTYFALVDSAAVR
jgi:hypothetical protein